MKIKSLLLMTLAACLLCACTEGDAITQINNEFDIPTPTHKSNEIPVAILSTNDDGITQTLTFTYADSTTANASDGGDGIYKLNTGEENPKWIKGATKLEVVDTAITKVVFEKSFSSARPTSTYHWFYEMTKLASIDGIEYLNTENVKDMGGMFWVCEALSDLDVSGFNTVNVTNMQGMFGNCKHLKKLNVSNFNTVNVTDMGWMFLRCSNLTELDVSKFKTDKVTDMAAMFESCSSLLELDVSGFNTDSVKAMDDMFYNCSSLTSIDVTTFNTSKVENMTWMFGKCSQLKELDISNFIIREDTYVDAMFQGCSRLEIINVGGNDFKYVHDSAQAFFSGDNIFADTFDGVGQMLRPCKLIVSSIFDKSVLGERKSTDKVSYYKWRSGYFSEPTVQF